MEKLFALLLTGVAIAAFLWLLKVNARDRKRMAEMLGLTLLDKGPQERGEDYVLGRFHQTALMSGTLHGFRATVWLRSIRRFTTGNSKNQSMVTVLAFSLDPKTRPPFRIEPAMTGKLQSWFGGDQPALPTGDAAFDALFRFTSADPSASRVLAPGLRARLMELRRGVVGDLPDNKAGRFAGDLSFGVFALEAERMTYTVMGTPSGKIAGHLKAAAPVLAELARAASGTA